MKVQTAQFVRELPFFGLGRRGSYNAGNAEWGSVQGVATQNGLQFTREQPRGNDVLVERLNVPYAQVLRWSPPSETLAGEMTRRKAEAEKKGGDKK